ncbi:UNVERIFIED_CONTAM: hypothetical protein Slati_1629100 [Sesamum latifolium]|uniref:Uncharacterized protein n=1 Tax=Sesamum latifolium TaxID=2727402 RepID=A0AAW2X9T0_9LAMI
MFTVRQNPQKWPFSDHKNSKSSSAYPSSSRNQTFLPRIFGTQNAANDRTADQNSSPAGRIKRLVLSQEGRTKLNNYPDREFYAYPRFVTHVDNNFISTLTNLYREILRPEMEILDLMSSWISHLPQEVKYKKVVGHGLNAQELARNPGWTISS